jgi:DNA invertase Pin-like site-specific DNA recombinase
MKKISCAIYVRKSVEDEVKKELTSLENQEIYCREFISANCDWVATQVYCDDGCSGGTTNRPALKAMLSDVEKGLIDKVIVYKYDRFTRSSADYFFMSTLLQQHGAAVVAATEQIDVSTPDGEFMMTNKMAMAQYERSITRVRVKEKIANSRKLGCWTGGTIPPGFKTVDRKLEPDEKFAPFILFMFKRFVQTRSQTTVAQELNAKAAQELSKDAVQKLKFFHRTRVSLLLKNPLYKGYVAHEGVLYKARHQEIIEEELWNQVQEILLQKPVKAPPQQRQFEPALTSRIRCHECNKSITVFTFNFSAFEGSAAQRPKIVKIN